MRKNSVFFLGAVAGTCLTLVVTASSGDLVIAAAKAAVSADTYSKLSLLAMCSSVSGPTMSRSRTTAGWSRPRSAHGHFA